MNKLVRKNAKAKNSYFTIANEHIEKYGEYESLEPDDFVELKKMKLDAPEFLDDVRDTILFASAPFSKKGVKELDRDLGSVIHDAERLLDGIGDVDNRFRLPGMYSHLDFLWGLECFIEDMKINLDKGKKKKDGIGGRYWKSRLTIEILAMRFQEHGLKPTTTIDGPFVLTADVVFGAANRITTGSVNESARGVVLEVLKQNPGR